MGCTSIKNGFKEGSLAVQMCTKPVPCCKTGGYGRLMVDSFALPLSYWHVFKVAFLHCLGGLWPCLSVLVRWPDSDTTRNLVESWIPLSVYRVFMLSISVSVLDLYDMMGIILAADF